MSPLTLAPFVTPTEGSLFYTVIGLPLHPLAVHAAVVLLPLSAVAVLALIARPAWRPRYGALTLVGLLVGTGAAIVAKESGEALAAKIGLPADHARWGDVLPLAALVLLVVGGLWIRRTRSAAGPGSGTTVLAGLSAAASVAVLALSALTGHSGAEAVWSGRLPDAASPTSGAPTPSAGATTSATSAAPSPATATTPTNEPSSAISNALTMAAVASHTDAASCWTVVDSVVYDITTWITQHPGGPEVIEALCGQDGTSAFRGQHAAQGEPNEALDGFELGPLAP